MQTMGLRPHSANNLLVQQTDNKLSLFFLIKSFNETVNGCEQCNCLSLAKKVFNIALPIIAAVNLLILPFIVAYNCCFASNTPKLQMKSPLESADKTTNAAMNVLSEKKGTNVAQDIVKENASDKTNRAPSLVTTTNAGFTPATQAAVLEEGVKQDETVVTPMNLEPAPEPQAAVLEEVVVIEVVVIQDEPAVPPMNPELTPAPQVAVLEEVVVTQDEAVVTPMNPEPAPEPQAAVLEEVVVIQDEPAVPPMNPELTPAPQIVVLEEAVVKQDETAVITTNPEPASAPPMEVREKEISAMDKFLMFDAPKPPPVPRADDDLIGNFIAGKSNPIPPTRSKSASMGHLRGATPMSNVKVGTAYSPGETNARKEASDLSFTAQVWGQAQNLGRAFGVIKD